MFARWQAVCRVRREGENSTPRLVNACAYAECRRKWSFRSITIETTFYARGGPFHGYIRGKTGSVGKEGMVIGPFRALGATRDHKRQTSA